MAVFDLLSTGEAAHEHSGSGAAAALSVWRLYARKSEVVKWCAVAA